MGVIFDLDQTLVDSSAASAHRLNRSWQEAYSAIKNFTLYDGVMAALTTLAEWKIPICIVTSSPSAYCTKVCKHWNINPDVIVAFHDTKYRKPDPAPMMLALQKLNLPANRVISFGDHRNDIIASNRANISSVACLWGADDRETIISANPMYVIELPSEIVGTVELFENRLS